MCGVSTIVCFMSKSRSSSQVARHLIPFDADDCFECRSELVSEKTRTAIGVHQNRAFPACADVVHDFSSDLIIGLRESSDGVILSNRNVAARRQSLVTQLSQLAVNYIGSKGAACNINDLATFLPKKSNRLPIRVDRNPVWEAIDFWTGDAGPNGNFGEFRNSAQGLFDLQPVQLQLRG